MGGTIKEIKVVLDDQTGMHRGGVQWAKSPHNFNVSRPNLAAYESLGVGYFYFSSETGHFCVPLVPMRCFTLGKDRSVVASQPCLAAH